MSYFSGQGIVYAAVRSALGVPAGFSFLGNCPSFNLMIGPNISLHAIGGGETVPKSVRSGEMPAVEMLLDDLNTDNLARTLYGQNTAVAVGSASNETVIGYVGKSVPLANINLSSFTSLTHASGTPTYTKDVDYTIDLPSGMISIPATGSAIVNVQSLRANYGIKAHTKVAIGTVAPPFLWLRFNGVNTANNMEPVVVDVFKVRFYPIDSLPLIGDALSALVVKGRIFYDPVQPDNLTDGRYVRIRQT